MPSTSHTFEIGYDTTLKNITWRFGGKTLDPKICILNAGDTITFTFAYMPVSGPVLVPNITMSALVAQSVPPKDGGPGPFGGGKVIDLHQHSTLKVHKGNWKFAICFCVEWPDGSINFGIVPDPELQVGSTSMG